MTRCVLICLSAMLLAPSQSMGADWSSRARSVASARLATRTQAPADNRAGILDDGVTPERARRIISGADSNPLQLAEADSAEDSTGATSAPAEKGAETSTEQETEIERGPLPGFGATVKRDVREMWCDLWEDTKAVYLNPYNVAFLVAAGGASLAVRPEVDGNIEHHYDHSHTFSSGFRNFLDAAGNPATGAIVAGTWYLTGQIMQQDKTYEVGKRLASALIITDVSTVLLKVSANTKAPNGMRGAWPSGHMSSTMALATVLNDAYGPVVGVPMFTFTAFLGIERLDDREHHFSDVIFGTALGWLVAEQVMKEHCPQIFGGDIVPYCDPETGATGIGWLKTLGN